MDNLTHSMVAVAMSRAGLHRVAPRATLTLLLAANAPDIDIVAATSGALAYLRHHRGFSHAVAAWPLLAALVVAVVWLFRRRQKRFAWLRISLVALVGVGSHLLMDFSNLYGVRPWLPFSGQWYSWDIVHIVDLWLWAVLLACLLGPWFGRLISREIGARPGSGRGAAIAALILVLAWWGARDVLHRRAVGMLEARLYGPESALRPPVQVAAFPSPWSPFRWRGFVETDSFYHILPLDLLRSSALPRGEIFYKPEPTAAFEAARRSRTASEFASFARFGYALIDRSEEGYRVVFSDFRFRGERRNAFVCTIVLDQNLRVVSEGFSF